MRREGRICPRHFREGQVNERKWKEEEGGRGRRIGGALAHSCAEGRGGEDNAV
jgi:hypothetical protein